MDIVVLPTDHTDNVYDSQNGGSSSELNTSTPDTSTNESVSKKISILLVDDDAMMNEMIKLIVGNTAHLVYAPNGDIALELAAEQQFDIIYLDINLKHRINGIEVQNLLRKMPRYANTPIVAFTAYAIIGDEERFLQHGFSYYLSKPFTIEEFLKCIRLEYPKSGF